MKPLRYRLRTLLVVVTAGCMLFAWAAYLRRMAHHHRQAAAYFMVRISQTNNLKPQKIEEAVQWLAAGTADEVRAKDWDGHSIVSFRRQPPFFQFDETAWQEAAYHSKMATIYDDALFYP